MGPPASASFQVLMARKEVSMLKHEVNKTVTGLLCNKNYNLVLTGVLWLFSYRIKAVLQTHTVKKSCCRIMGYVHLLLMRPLAYYKT